MTAPAEVRGIRPSCTVCRRTISITASGLVRLHGPIRACCPGSRRASLDVLSSQRSTIIEVGPPSPQPFSQSSVSLPPMINCKIVKRIPRNSRDLAAKKLASILEAVVSHNDCASWDRLLRFGSRCLRLPSNQGRPGSLTSALNKQISEEVDPPNTPVPSPPRTLPKEIQSSPLLLVCQQS